MLKKQMLLHGRNKKKMILGKKFLLLQYEITINFVRENMKTCFAKARSELALTRASKQLYY